MWEERDRLLEAAERAHRSGQTDEALRQASAALDLDSTSVTAKFLLGLAYARKRDYSNAESMLREVLGVDPDAFEALVSLSTVLRDVGKLDESIVLGRQAVALRPNEAQAHNNLGRSFLAAKRLAEAAGAFVSATEIQPRFAAAHHNLGKTRQLEGKDRDASASFAQALALAPSLENILAYGQIQLTLGNVDDAIKHAQKAVSLSPRSATAQLLLCGALTRNNQGAEAESHLRRAIELDTEGREALQIAFRQRPLGHIDEANASFRKAIEQNPRCVSAYTSLVQNQKVTEADRDLVTALHALLEDREVTPPELASIHFGLGKALEDLAEFADSMRHYDEANRITREIKLGDLRFDPKRYAATVDRMIDLFPSQLPLNLAAEPSDLPVLIIGMMRSGTSLAEQILSSHTEVAGAGELLFWPNNWPRILGPRGDSLEMEVLARLGREYIEELRAFAPTAKRVTDKMPGNYIFAGSIHLALPNARLIHMRRNPVDTCISIWATPNHTPHEGGHQKAGIAFVYKEYMRLMEFWRKVLPQGRFLEVDYEELVSNPERTIRKMLSFCGLEWDEACLHPQENRRLVTTPSTWQIRQPFYGTSVARWRRFEPWLGEFHELAGISHPAQSERR